MKPIVFLVLTESLHTPMAYTGGVGRFRLDGHDEIDPSLGMAMKAIDHDMRAQAVLLETMQGVHFAIPWARVASAVYAPSAAPSEVIDMTDVDRGNRKAPRA